MASKNENDLHASLKPLAKWPYASRQLLRMPHPEIVEGHARNLLSRALNVGRLTAFVGSGASMAYGRISWIDMLYAAQQTVLNRYKKEKIEDSLEAGEHVKLLHRLVQQHEIKRGSRPDASSQLTVFQLAEELDKEIDFILKKQGNEQNQSTFRETVMWVTRDERGHAEQLLKDAFLDEDIPDHSLTFADFEGSVFKDCFVQGRDADPLDNEMIEKLVLRTLRGSDLTDKKRLLPHRDRNRSGSRNEAFPSKVDDEIDQEIYGAVEQFLSLPLARYRLAALMQRVSRKQRLRILMFLASQINAELQRAPQKATKNPPRSEVIPESLDPLLILHRMLNIRRFLTTNYDYEIERLFADIGYHRSLDHAETGGVSDEEVGDPIAPSFKEAVFGRRETGELAALVTSDRSRRRANWVVHLHGRAHHDGKIIVTEDDYQQLYARDDEYRSAVDDAIKLAFSAQPILFAGIGMEEVDLLRPLREFMSEPARLGDRLGNCSISPGKQAVIE